MHTQNANDVLIVHLSGSRHFFRRVSDEPGFALIRRRFVRVSLFRMPFGDCRDWLVPYFSRALCVCLRVLCVSAVSLVANTLTADAEHAELGHYPRLSVLHRRSCSSEAG